MGFHFLLQGYPRPREPISCIGTWILYHWATWEALYICINIRYLFFTLCTSLYIVGSVFIHLISTNSNFFFPFYGWVTFHCGLPKWLSGKESTCQCKRCRRHRLDPWSEKIPWRRKWQPSPIFLPGKIPWTEEPGKLQSIGLQRATQLSNWACTQYSIVCMDHKFFIHSSINGHLGASMSWQL